LNTSELLLVVTCLLLILQTAYCYYFFGYLAKYLLIEYLAQTPANNYWQQQLRRIFLENNGALPTNNNNPALLQQIKPVYVSVIICAKNEAHNLLRNLPIILTQNYPNYEVIVINDASTDKTVQILQEFQITYPNLRVISLTNDHKRTLKGKKHALSNGIAAAKHDFLVLTDADCQPTTDQWLQYMTLNHAQAQKNNPTLPNEKIILGYSPYEYQNTCLNACVQYETLLTAMQYLSYALRGIPYMGVGRNLAYSKKFYDQQHSFTDHAHIASGDDDLFINKIANKHNTFVILHPHSFCVSQPPTTWRQWINQKKRHLSTATHYKPKHQILLGTWTVLHFLPNLLIFALGLYQPNYWNYLIGLYALKLIVQLPITYRIARQLKCPLSIGQLITLDLFWVAYYLFFSLTVFRKKTTLWK
jgi:biofilm PGA synthesis N-glycosyltransferase PgaC